MRLDHVKGFILEGLVKMIMTMMPTRTTNFTQGICNDTIKV